MHEKANTAIQTHSLEAKKRACTLKRIRCKTTRQLSAFARARKRVCMRKPNMSVKAHSQKKETCMHEKANTSFGNVHARESQHIT